MMQRYRSCLLHYIKMAATSQFIINGELTDQATLTESLINRCTVSIGEIIPIRNNDEEVANDKNSSAPSRNKQYFQRFLEFTYPGGTKSTSIIIPNVVVHNELGDYFNKTSVMFGVPQSSVRLLEPKISSAGGTADFKDRKLMSDEKFWWTRSSFNEAAEGREYIRIMEDDDEIMYGSWPDFFAEYPTSVIANVTCSIKMTCELDKGQEPKKGDYWRAGLRVSMVTPVDAIDIPKPQSGTAQRSIAGKRDAMRAGLKNMRRAN